MKGMPNYSTMTGKRQIGIQKETREKNGELTHDNPPRKYDLVVVSGLEAIAL
jgi:hypothetical protein